MAHKMTSLTQDTPSPPLERTLRIYEVNDGEERLIETNQGEREAIAALLDLVALERLGFAFRLYRHGEGRMALSGTLAASVTQTCVVSLEPVESRLEIPVEIEFWPVSLVEEQVASIEETGSQGTLDWPEPIVDGKIDLGRVIYETFATSLDPYPRREGVSFNWADNAAEPPEAERAGGPFASLKQLKQQ